MSQKPTKKMSLMDSVLMAVGGIIGAGIFSITGTAVGAAGPAVPVAFLLAGFFSLMLCVPHMLISSAIPAKGGQYLYVARFLSPLLGFLSIWNSIMHICLVSIMGISAGQYLPQIIPALTPKMASTIVVVGITVACLLNARASAKVQNLMVILILVSLALFIGMGAPHVEHWSPKDIGSASVAGVLLAVSFVRSSAWGAVTLVNMGGEIENPGKTVPRAIGGSTAGVSLLYAIVGIICIGVIPWQDMVGQPLSVPAAAFMPRWAFNFLVIGGALFAVSTTLLSNLMNYSRGIWAGAADGIFPKWFDKVNKYGVPYRILIIMAIIGLIPIWCGVSLSKVFATLSAPAMLLNLMATFPILVAPKKLPKKFEKAWFRLPRWAVWIVTAINTISTLIFSYLLFRTLNAITIVAIAGFYGAGILYYYLRIKYLKEKQGIDLEAKMAAYDPSWLEDEEPAAAEKGAVTV